MDAFKATLDGIGSLIDYIFIGYCRIITHCFKFIELVVLLVDCVIDVVATFIRYNNLLYSIIFDFLYDTATSIQALPNKLAIFVGYLLQNIFIDIPWAVFCVTRRSITYSFSYIKENASELTVSFGNYCYVIFPLIFTTLVEAVFYICAIPFQLMAKLLFLLIRDIENIVEGFQTFFSSLQDFSSLVCITIGGGFRRLFDLLSPLSGVGDFFKRGAIAVINIPKGMMSMFPNLTDMDFMIWTRISKVPGLAIGGVCDAVNSVYFATCYVSKSVYFGICYVIAGIFSIIKLLLEFPTLLIFNTLCVLYDFVLFSLKSIIELFAGLHIFQRETLILFFLLVSSTILTQIIYFNYCPAIVLNVFRKTISSGREVIVHYVNIVKDYTNLFGADRPCPAFGQRPKSDNEAKTSCVVCHDHEKTVVLMPCRHLCLCAVCYRKIMRQRPSQRNCPMCRRSIQDSISVYM